MTISAPCGLSRVSLCTGSSGKTAELKSSATWLARDSFREAPGVQGPGSRSRSSMSSASRKKSHSWKWISAKGFRRSKTVELLVFLLPAPLQRHWCQRYRLQQLSGYLSLRMRTTREFRKNSLDMSFLPARIRELIMMYGP